MRNVLLYRLSRDVDGTWDRYGVRPAAGYAVTWREFTSLLIPVTVRNELSEVELRHLVEDWGDNLPAEVQHFGSWHDHENHRQVLSPIIVTPDQRRATAWARAERQRYFYDLGSGEVCEVPI